VIDAIGRFRPISLEEVTAGTALQARVERKYIASAEQAAELLERLGDSHRALDIGGLREFAYRTTYYDTPDLLCLREHLQGRRRRFKCRRREYVDTGGAFLELKLRGRRGRTVKHGLECRGRPGLDEEQRAFVRETLLRGYGRAIPVEAFAPSLAIDVRRMTLASDVAEERVTLDVAVQMGGWRLGDGLVIVETKTLRGPGAADLALRRLGLRPQRCSKYCIGMMLHHSPRRGSALRPAARRFVAAAA